MPAASAEVVNVATALLFSVPVPSEVAPSRKATAPVGVPALEDMIVAVNVTGAPLGAESAELSNAAVVGANVIVSVTAAEALAAKFALPAYLQVIE